MTRKLNVKSFLKLKQIHEDMERCLTCWHHNDDHTDREYSVTSLEDHIVDFHDEFNNARFYSREEN